MGPLDGLGADGVEQAPERVRERLRRRLRLGVAEEHAEAVLAQPTGLPHRNWPSQPPLAR